MPAVVGASKIVSVGGGGILKFGDSVFMSPTSSSKSFAGSGSLNIGDVPITINVISTTNTIDPSVIDANATKIGFF